MNDLVNNLLISIISTIAVSLFYSLFSNKKRKAIDSIIDKMDDVEDKLLKYNNKKRFDDFNSCIDYLEKNIEELKTKINFWTYFFAFRKKRLMELYISNISIFIRIIKVVDKEYPSNDRRYYLSLQCNDNKDFNVYWLKLNVAVLKYLNQRGRVSKCYRHLMSDNRVKEPIVSQMNKVLSSRVIQQISDDDKVYRVLKRMVTPFSCNLKFRGRNTMSKKKYDSLMNKYCGSKLSCNQLKEDEMWYKDIYPGVDVGSLEKFIDQHKQEVLYKYNCRDKNKVRIEFYRYGITWVRIVYNPQNIIKECVVYGYNYDFHYAYEEIFKCIYNDVLDWFSQELDTKYLEEIKLSLFRLIKSGMSVDYYIDNEKIQNIISEKISELVDLIYTAPYRPDISKNYILYEQAKLGYGRIYEIIKKNIFQICYEVDRILR